MKLSYINQIKANISIFSSRKTSNILDGTYRSIYRGKSMNFENLREYVINDDVKDIDWKASSRSGTLLVKQFIAEKKHNIMIVLDTGIKMDGDTSSNENKKEIALLTAGTIGYIAIKNGDYIGMMYNFHETTNYKPFKYNLYNLEQYLTEYERDALSPNTNGLDQVLTYIYKNIKKKMIIFVVTDSDGINRISPKTLKTISTLNDCMFVNIEDAFISNNQSFDLETSSYIPTIISKDNKLREIEIETKRQMNDENNLKLKKCNMNMVTIGKKAEIVNKIIELIERHNNASTN